MNAQAMTYSNRSNAIRAAKVALAKAGNKQPLVDVHFKVDPTDGGFVWRPINMKTGEVGSPAGGVLDALEAGAAEAAMPDPAMVGGVRFSDPARAEDARRALAEPTSAAAGAGKQRVGKPARTPKPKAAKGPKAERASKKDQVLGLLKRPGGVTVAQIQAATGWLPHTTRAFISTVPKGLGLTVETEKGDAGRVYRIAQPEVD